MTRWLPGTADLLARLAARFVPDAFSIACVLALVTLALGVTVGGASLEQCVLAWGQGFWELLAFSMQIVVVIFAGYLVAVSPPVARLLDRAAGWPRSPAQAVAFTAFLSMALCWIHWGAGLIAAALLVRCIARRHPDVDYRLLVAVAYLGLGLTWHAGPSGSVPLLLATPDSFMIRAGLITTPLPLSATVFTPANLGLTGLVLILFTLFAWRLHPAPEHTRRADPVALAALERFEVPARPARPTPAERIMWSALLNRSVGLLGVAAFVLQRRAPGASLTLDSVNLLFLSLGIGLHPHTASLLRAGEEGARALHGVVMQFPLYAGIYGIMKGTALAQVFTQAFLSVATPGTYALVVFWYSAFLNYFVPSGGGKWAIEAPYVLGAGQALGIPPAQVAMAYAYGDMATNIIQPFWAIPLLGVARLEFRDILGYEVLVFLLYALLVSGFLLAF
jgi:short-chain fatty acids transporter